MSSRTEAIELNFEVNRALTNSDFVGYKSTPREFPFTQIALKSAVSRQLTPKSTVELYLRSLAYHNHLHFDPARKLFYFLDKFGVVWRSNCDFSAFNSVWTIPNNACSDREDNPFVYYPTVHFLDSYYLVTNGRNSLYLLDTEWSIVGEFDELLPENFRIVDSKQKNDEFNLLLLQINRKITTESVLTFLKLKKILDWEIVEKKTLYNTGSVSYASLNRSCSAIYMVSNGTTSSQFDGNGMRLELGEWKQTATEVEIQLVLNRILDKKMLDISINSFSICVTCKDAVIFGGEFLREIDADSAYYTVSLTTKSIEVHILKKESNVSWKSLLKENDRNFEVFEVHDFTPTNESPSVYFAANIEECDLYDEQELNFERFDVGETKPSHYCEIGRRQFLFNSESTADAAKLFVLRHNVDAVAVRPIECNDDGVVVDVRLEHIGTLPAFGYIQAAKTERKFFDCPEDFSYSIITESFRNIYFYSHRYESWLKSKEKAEQKILNLPNAGDEIVGCFCTPAKFFILTNHSFFTFTV